MASVYGMVRTLMDNVPSYPVLRSIIRRKPVAVAAIRGPGDDVATLVATEIILRLMVAHSDHVAPSETLMPITSIGAADVAALVPITLEREASDVLAYVERFLARGIGVETILVDLLAPVARALGTLWEDDEADFVAVTMGMWRLQEVVREVSARIPYDDGGHRRALFAAMPGEQHSFGTVLIDEVFRRNGWSTTLMAECTRSELLSAIADRDFDLVGLTVMIDRCSEEVPHLINAVRSVSRNPRVGVMVGGCAFPGDPARALAVGADATAADAKQALAVASALVDGRAASSIALAS